MIALAISLVLIRDIPNGPVVPPKASASAGPVAPITGVRWMHFANSIPGRFGVFSNGSFRPLPIPVPGNWYQWDDGSLLYQVAW